MKFDSSQILILTILGVVAYTFVGHDSAPTTPFGPQPGYASQVKTVVVLTAKTYRKPKPDLPDDLGENTTKSPEIPEPSVVNVNPERPVAPTIEDLRPIVRIYIGNTYTCAPCRVLAQALDSLTIDQIANLPFQLLREPPPSWVPSTPTWHWQDTRGNWRQYQTPSVDEFSRVWRATQAFQSAPVQGVYGLGSISMGHASIPTKTDSSVARQLVDTLFQTMGQGNVKLTDNYSVLIPETVQLTLTRSGNRIALNVNGQPPRLRLQYLGIKYDALIQGIGVENRRMTIKLGGFPDVGFDIE